MNDAGPLVSIDRTKRFLVCRASRSLCALPLEAVVETFRPLPVEAVSGVPAVVAGVAVVRGEPLAVVALGRLLGESEVRAGRFVVMRTGGKKVVLAVADVVGLRMLSPGTAADLPGLIAGASREAVAALATLDGELLLMLEAARIASDDVLEVVAARAAS
jgi:purine-binding chemotaxis protein CheW